MADLSVTADRRWLALGLSVALALGAMGASCSEDRPAEHPRPPAIPELTEGERPDPSLRLLLITDLDGYLEPCGCTSRPLGGIDRMAARLAERASVATPTIRLAAGNLLFHGAPHGADAERAAAQEQMKAETLVAILETLELDAAGVGPLDFSFGVEAFSALAEQADFPLLSSGVSVEGSETPRLGGPTVIETDGRRVGVFGLAELAGVDGSMPEGVSVEGTLEARARAGVEALVAQDVDLVVALVTAERRAARRLARIEGLDVIVHGGLDAADASPPSSSAGAIVVAAGRQGQGLVVLDLLQRGDGDWTDASLWTRQERRAHLESEVEALQARIAEWEADEGSNPADVARQRARVQTLRDEMIALAHPPPPEGNAFWATYEELDPDAARAAPISRMMEELTGRVNVANEAAFADWAPEPAPEGEPHYVGSEACATCHQAAVTWWRGHAHGRAYATLVDRDKNFDLSCVGCHVTGYLRPGGSTVTHVGPLADVGCENCHGPGSRHVETTSPSTLTVDPPERTCLGCHNPEHSDTFDFDVYRQLLIAPGHGEPAARP